MPNSWTLSIINYYQLRSFLANSVCKWVWATPCLWTHCGHQVLLEQRVEMLCTQESEVFALQSCSNCLCLEKAFSAQILCIPKKLHRPFRYFNFVVVTIPSLIFCECKTMCTQLWPALEEGVRTLDRSSRVFAFSKKALWVGTVDLQAA